jgi:hypothetical protein
MKAPNASALSLFLALAALLTLPSCSSFGRPVTTLTPRSESVCDQTPPEPIPPIPDEHPGLEAAFRAVIGLYRNEIVKDTSERSCRGAVRKENAEAARIAASGR